MKNMGVLLSTLTFMMIAQHTQTVAAPPGCTDVTVTYAGEGPPLDVDHLIGVRNVDFCGHSGKIDNHRFQKSGETLSLQSNQDICLKMGVDWSCRVPQMKLVGTPVNVVCTYGRYQSFENCKLQ